MLADGQCTVISKYSRRERTVSRRRVVAWNYIARIIRADAKRSRRHLGVGNEPTDPRIGRISILVAERAIVLPAHSQVQCQLSVDLPVVLHERIHIRQSVTMN